MWYLPTGAKIASNVDDNSRKRYLNYVPIIDNYPEYDDDQTKSDLDKIDAFLKKSVLAQQSAIDLSTINSCDDNLHWTVPNLTDSSITGCNTVTDSIRLYWFGRLQGEIPCVQDDDRRQERWITSRLLSDKSNNLAAFIFNGFKSVGSESPEYYRMDGQRGFDNLLCVYDKQTNTVMRSRFASVEGVELDYLDGDIVISHSPRKLRITGSRTMRPIADIDINRLGGLTSVFSALRVEGYEIAVATSRGLYSFNYRSEEWKLLDGRPTVNLALSKSRRLLAFVTTSDEYSVVNTIAWSEPTSTRTLGSTVHGIGSASVSPDLRFMVTTDESSETGKQESLVKRWNIQTGDVLDSFKTAARPSDIAISANLGVIALTSLDGVEVRVAGRTLDLGPHQNDSSTAVAMADSAQLIITASKRHADVWRIEEDQAIFVAQLFPFEADQNVDQVAACQRGSLVAFTTSDSQGRNSELVVMDVDHRKELLRRKIESYMESFQRVVFGPSCKALAVSHGGGKVSIYHLGTLDRNVKVIGCSGEGVPCPISAPVFLDDEVIVSFGFDAQCWDVATGKPIKSRYDRVLSAIAVAENPMSFGAPLITRNSAGDRANVAVTRNGTRLDFWVLEPGILCCGLLNGGSVSVDFNGGRFDYDFRAASGLTWSVSDSPLNPLPLEIFMRDYYEPRLLARLLSGEKLPDVPPLGDLNRVQPLVEVMDVHAGEHPDEAEVTVKVSSNHGDFQRNGQTVTMETDVHDLRLFRDGQLVWQWPEPKPGTVLKNGVTLTGAELEDWRKATCIPLMNGAAVKTFTVRLPHLKAGKDVQFSAYAFNVDRVKSATYKRDYPVPANLSAVQPRAYVISVGVNGYQDPSWNLRFAVSDARRMKGALETSELTKQYKVVPVLLTSEGPVGGVRDHATKAAFQAVLDRLSGKREDLPPELSKVANADRLREALPDDLVILTVSSHGYTDYPSGMFYLIPSDSGQTTGEQTTAASLAPLLKKWISSDELSEWLRGVDAGDLVMIVDTCHSAGTVDAPGFKPGPMGSRGLGQLAYDKGMRILAASQANDVALESEKIKQGLLTYALVQNGLMDHKAAGSDGKGEITLDGWLQYGVDRVPQIYEEILKTGKIKGLGLHTRDTSVNVALSGGTSSLKKNAFQQPSLFNFNKDHARQISLGDAVKREPHKVTFRREL